MTDEEMRSQLQSGMGGTSGEKEPTWPDKSGEEVKDGDLTWQCVKAPEIKDMSLVSKLRRWWKFSIRKSLTANRRMLIS